MANTAEYKALRACTQSLVDGFVALGPETVADFLFSESLISEKDYSAVTLDKVPQDKGRQLVQSVTASIKHNSTLFDKLLDVLKRNNGADNLVELLEDKYKEISVRPTYEASSLTSFHEIDSGPVDLPMESSLISLSDKIENIESKFLNLAESLLAHLESSNFQVERLTACISLLPRSINIYVFPMWKKICKKVSKDETLNSLFTVLNMEVWNILDYKLLEHFIKKCGNQKLEREMSKYILELEKFKKKTLVVDFIECWEGHNREIPDYDEVKIKFDKHCLTLANVDAFRKTLARKCIPSLLDYAGWIYYKHFKGGCFVVSLLLPDQLVLLLKHHIGCMHMVLIKYGVIEIVLCDTVIYDQYKYLNRDRSYSLPNCPPFALRPCKAVRPRVVHSSSLVNMRQNQNNHQSVANMVYFMEDFKAIQLFEGEKGENRAENLDDLNYNLHQPASTEHAKQWGIDYNEDEVLKKSFIHILNEKPKSAYLGITRLVQHTRGKHQQVPTNRLQSKDYGSRLEAINLYALQFTCIFPEARACLNHDIDQEHNIFTLARDFFLWEAMAPQLHLDDMDIHDIKNKHSIAEEQRLAALLLWKSRTSGTYHDLLKICCAGGDMRTATIICGIVNKGSVNAEPHMGDSAQRQLAIESDKLEPSGSFTEKELPKELTSTNDLIIYFEHCLYKPVLVAPSETPSVSRKHSAMTVVLHITLDEEDEAIQTSIQVENLLIEWNNANVIIPHDQLPTETLISIDLSTFLAEVLESREAIHEQNPDTRSFHSRKTIIESIVKHIVIYNRFYQYRPFTHDSQAFIKGIMGALKIDTLPYLTKALSSYIEDLERGVEQFPFSHHSELDDYVTRNIHTMSIGMCEYSAVQYFLFHLELRKCSSKAGNETWKCPVHKCQLFTLLLKLS